MHQGIQGIYYTNIQSLYHELTPNKMTILVLTHIKYLINTPAWNLEGLLTVDLWIGDTAS